MTGSRTIFWIRLGQILLACNVYSGFPTGNSTRPIRTPAPKLPTPLPTTLRPTPSPTAPRPTPPITASPTEPPIPESGNQGTRWINVKLTLVGTPLYVIISSFRGKDFASDLAIDDIEVTDGPCFDFTKEQVCTFDDTTCFLYQSPEDDFNWLMTNKETQSDSTGPSTGVNGGYYLYMEASYKNRGDQALLTTPLLSGANSRCLSFYYHMYGVSMGSLIVYRATSFAVARMLEKTGNQGNEWRYVDVQIDDTDGLMYSILIEGTVGSGHGSDIALDNIRLRPGKC